MKTKKKVIKNSFDELAYSLDELFDLLPEEKRGNADILLKKMCLEFNELKDDLEYTKSDLTELEAKFSFTEEVNLGIDTLYFGTKNGNILVTEALQDITSSLLSKTGNSSCTFLNF